MIKPSWYLPTVQQRTRGQSTTTMGKCPTCNKEVYFAERQPYNNKDFHKTCFKCTKCGKKLTPGKISEHDGQLYCPHPCYADLFGPHGKK